ncbi:hypothetical protein HanOQP8_Chr16g0628351 [Helianthus annuus]|uniref:Uncharacterized protein n=1 Tax=Helianthus annuus TaxID=4232 RepID=A0A251S1R5_HELAN|nr:hypothetical protein HanIR_Chr16g0829241 [Helianthus annuus]KAJ0645837.1 hypothetical protein HanOQP8_Chr16g0628351 [Helianthus annuus]
MWLAILSDAHKGLVHQLWHKRGVKNDISNTFLGMKHLLAHMLRGSNGIRHMYACTNRTRIQ